MQFFKVSGLIDEDAWFKEHNRRGMRRQKTRDLVAQDRYMESKISK